MKIEPRKKIISFDFMCQFVRVYFILWSSRQDKPFFLIIHRRRRRRTQQHDNFLVCDMTMMIGKVTARRKLNSIIVTLNLSRQKRKKKPPLSVPFFCSDNSHFRYTPSTYIFFILKWAKITYIFTHPQGHKNQKRKQKGSFIFLTLPSCLSLELKQA